MPPELERATTLYNESLKAQTANLLAIVLIIMMIIGLLIVWGWTRGRIRIPATITPGGSVEPAKTVTTSDLVIEMFTEYRKRVLDYEKQLSDANKHLAESNAINGKLGEAIDKLTTKIGASDESDREGIKSLGESVGASLTTAANTNAEAIKILASGIEQKLVDGALARADALTHLQQTEAMIKEMSDSLNANQEELIQKFEEVTSGFERLTQAITNLLTSNEDVVTSSRQATELLTQSLTQMQVQFNILKTAVNAQPSSDDGTPPT